VRLIAWAGYVVLVGVVVLSVSAADTWVTIGLGAGAFAWLLTWGAIGAARTEHRRRRIWQAPLRRVE
jgi:hypothetical protein